MTRPREGSKARRSATDTGWDPTLSSRMANATVPKLRKAIRRKPPGLGIERDLWAAGREVVVGVDEVGRGAWAGPLTVGAAVVPKDRRVYKIRDSKMLTEDEREALFERVGGWCEAWSVGHASHEECDRLGMSEAQRLAAQRALAGLDLEVDHVLVDGKWDFIGSHPTERIVKGDGKSLSIAAASILAKVTRDRIMRALARDFTLYNFANNKGYPCPTHKASLVAYGPSTIHRQSWAFMDWLPWNALERFERPEPQMRLF